MRPLAPDDDALAGEAAAIFDETLGPGYVPAGDLLALAGAPRPEAGVFLALVEGALAGAALVDRATPEILSRIGLSDLADRRVGHLRTSAVRRTYRRQGIGSALLEHRLARLRAADCTAAVALSWLSGDRDNSQGLLAAHGLEPVARLPDYWRADPPGSGLPCPVCGADCRCAAAVYVARW